MTTGAETTNDLDRRLSTLEAGQQATNTRLDSLEQSFRELRTEVVENQRENNRRFDQLQQENNLRFDQLYAAIVQNQADTNTRLERVQQENNRRFDQLFYTVIGAATALLVALIILIVRGG